MSGLFVFSPNKLRERVQGSKGGFPVAQPSFPKNLDSLPISIRKLTLESWDPVLIGLGLICPFEKNMETLIR